MPRKAKADRSERKNKLNTKRTEKKDQVSAKKTKLQRRKQKAEQVRADLENTLSKLTLGDQMATHRVMDAYYRKALLAAEEEKAEDKVATRADAVAESPIIDDLLELVSESGADLLLTHTPDTLQRVYNILNALAGEDDTYEATDELLGLLLTECALEDRD